MVEGLATCKRAKPKGLSNILQNIKPIGRIDIINDCDDGLNGQIRTKADIQTILAINIAQVLFGGLGAARKAGGGTHQRVGIYARGWVGAKGQHEKFVNRMGVTKSIQLL